MLNTTLHQMTALLVSGGVNIILGMYYNINLKRCKFCKTRFLTGIIKALIIIVSFIGIAYCFDVTDLSQLGVSPDLVMNAAVVLYVSKSLQNLINILGVEKLGEGDVHNKNV